MLGIVIFGAAMLTDAPPIPADAIMPRFPPIATFGAAMFRLIDGIEIFGSSILKLGAAIVMLGIEIFGAANSVAR